MIRKSILVSVLFVLFRGHQGWVEEPIRFKAEGEDMAKPSIARWENLHIYMETTIGEFHPVAVIGLRERAIRRFYAPNDNFKTYF